VQASGGEGGDRHTATRRGNARRIAIFGELTISLLSGKRKEGRLPLTAGMKGKNRDTDPRREDLFKREEGGGEKELHDHWPRS